MAVKPITQLAAASSVGDNDVLLLVDQTTNPAAPIGKKVDAIVLKQYIQDVAGILIADTATIDVTYAEGSGTITLDVKPGTVAQNTNTRKDGSLVGSRSGINFTDTGLITITATDDSGNNRVNLDITSAAIGGVTSLSAAGTTFALMKSLQTNGDNSKTILNRVLKSLSDAIVLSLTDTDNAISFTFDPAQVPVNDLDFTSPLAIANGGTNAADAGTARSNLGVAASGANTDITSIAGLVTPLAVNQGGTGANNATTALTNLGAVFTAVNVGVGGQGLFKQKALASGNNRLEFRNINAGVNGYLTVTLDNGNNEIDIEAVPNAILSAGSQNMALNGFKITGLGAPTADGDAATKAYVDATAQGLIFKDPARLATTANLSGTYAGGPKTLTNNTTQAALAIDGVTVVVADRILVKNQTTATQNGVYVVTTVGTISTNWVLTRATDFDENAEIVDGAFVFVSEGSLNAGSSFVQATADPVLDTNDIVFNQFAQTGNTEAGTGLSKSGSTISLANTAVTPGVYGTASAVATVTVDQQGRITSASNTTIQSGTTSQAGIVQLSDAINSTSTTLAGTANAVKTAYDLAATKLNSSAVSAFGLTLVDDADAATARTTLGAAALASPTFTGTPAAPTASVNTNTTQLATTAFVVAQIADDAPTKAGVGATGTWGIDISGLAANATALGGVASASYALLANPTFTGAPAAPTAVADTNTTQLATTAFVNAQIATRFSRPIVVVAGTDINCSTGNYFTKTIAANTTFAFINAPLAVAYAFTFELTHTSGTVTWPASVKWPGDTAPTLTTGKTHLFMFVTDDGGFRWRGAALVDYVN